MYLDGGLDEDEDEDDLDSELARDFEADSDGGGKAIGGSGGARERRSGGGGGGGGMDEQFLEGGDGDEEGTGAAGAKPSFLTCLIA